MIPIKSGIALALAFAATVAAAPAAATEQSSLGWNYTRWGMTPEEVVAASNGAARLYAPPPVPGATGAILAVGTMPGGAFDFEVSFTFSNSSRALTHVSLKAPPAQCAPIIRELAATYGAPYHAPRSTLATQASWEDRAKNLDVSIFAGGGTCLVTYKPARPAISGL